VVTSDAELAEAVTSDAEHAEQAVGAEQAAQPEASASSMSASDHLFEQLLGTATPISEETADEGPDAEPENGSSAVAKEKAVSVQPEASTNGGVGGSSAVVPSAVPAVGGSSAVVPLEVTTEQGAISFGSTLSFSQQASCTKCGYHVDPFEKGVRLLTKSPPSYRCNKCCTKYVQLVRMFGTWPIPEFKELNEQTQLDFFKNSESSVKNLRRSVEQLLVQQLIERRTMSEQGPYLPLTVWAAKGYDVEAIKSKAPMLLHRVLGPTYQVEIVSSGRELISELARSDVLRTLEKKKRVVGQAVGTSSSSSVAAAEAKAPAAVVEASESNDSSSDSSSESSSSGKKSKKKSKKSKKSKSKKSKKSDKSDKTDKTDKNGKKVDKLSFDRERKNQLLALEKAEKKQVAKNQADCTKCLSKISPLMLMLSALLADEHINHCPKFAVAKAKDAMKALTSFETEAKAKLIKADSRELGFTIEQINDTFKEPHAAHCSSTYHRPLLSSAVVDRFPNPSVQW
jgi:hypothetical protein